MDSPTPQASIAAEQAVLGALMIESRAWAEIAGKLAASDFSRADHRAIFQAIEDLAGRGQAVDVVVLEEALTRRGDLERAGGLAYLGELARDTAGTKNVVHYASIVCDRAMLRRLAALGDRIRAAACDPGERTGRDIVTSAQRALGEMQSRARDGRGLVDAGTLAAEFTDDLDRRLAGARGLSVGLADFDELTNGLEPGDLVVIAGRPGMGKTALLVSIATGVDAETGVAVFSAEMPANQLMRRAVARLARLDQRSLRRPQTLIDADFRTIGDAAAQLGKRLLWIDDRPLPPLAHLRAEIVAIKMRDPRLGLVLVDYVQLVTGTGANRYEQLREVAYGLKSLAKELAIPVIVLAQLNRSVESRDEKRPHLADLRDSGAIEEAADIVGMLYSPAYYDPEFAMHYALECQIVKNRNGERGECLWRFSPEFSDVTTLDAGAAAQYRHLRARERSSSRGDL